MDAVSKNHEVVGISPEAFLPRLSLCLGEGARGSVHHGDAGFAALLNKHYNNNHESDAAERLVNLKRALKTHNTKLPWDKLLEELSMLGQAQCGFVSYQLDETSGETTSQDLITKAYFNDGSGNQGLLGDRNYSTIVTACQNMKHGKVFLIPDGLCSCAAPNDLPFPTEALMAMPLWSGDRNIGHFGMMWTMQGLQEHSLSWSYIEMLLHSLEDLFAQRVLEETILLEPVISSLADPISHDITTNPQASSTPPSPMFAHPLKPYAPSLSHELRTPMQGVVGMLDVMHANVEEAIDARVAAKSFRLLQDLKENIELVQDSARRAVEAADNVVHAYDLNMEVPETPQKEVYARIMGDILPPPAIATGERFSFKESKLPVNPYKRRRSISIDWTGHGRAPKRFSRRNASQGDLSPRSEVKNAIQESDKIVYSPANGRIEEVVGNAVAQRPSLATRRMAPRMIIEGVPPTAARQTKIRELLHLVVNESLHVGKRPESTLSQKTLLGERINVHALASNGETCIKSIEWSVEPTVPDTLYVDERDLAKLISCVFLNAVKFTESGEIMVLATSSNKTPHYVRINIRDTGMGIPEEFFPSLFKPFAREDDSTTRTRDGLGLGLLVAKGLARKMGGDLLCVHSSTSGPERGSEFEIRIPLNPGGVLSRPVTSHNESAAPLATLPLPPKIGAPTKLAVDVTIANAANQPDSMDMLPPPETMIPVDQPDLLPGPAVQKQALMDSYPESQTISQPPSTPRGVPLGKTHPLTFLVAEDNQINRKILVNMLRKLGYRDVYEAYDGREAVRIMQETLRSSYPLPSPMSSPSIQETDSGIEHSHSPSDMANPGNRRKSKPIDVVLMDLWMPEMDGYEATSKIFELVDEHCNRLAPINNVEHIPEENWDQRSESPFPSISDISPKVLAVSADVTDESLNRASQVGIQGYMTKPYKLADLERLIVDCCFPQV